MEYARDGQIVLNIAPRAAAIWNWRMMRYALTRALAAFASGFCAAGCRAGYLRP